MNRLRIFTLMALLVIAAHADAGQIEPKYKGKPLAYWVDRLQSAPTDAEQQQAAEAIAAFGADADSAVPKLVEMLDDLSPKYRRLVIGILGEVVGDAKSVVPAMIKLLKEKRARDPELVIEILQYAGPKAKGAVPVLADSLANEKLAKSAISALGAIGPAAKDSVPALVKMLDHGDAEVRVESARALWRIAKHPKAVPALISILEAGNNPDVMNDTIYTLGEIGPDAKAALPALRRLGQFGGLPQAIEKIEGPKKSKETP